MPRLRLLAAQLTYRLGMVGMTGLSLAIFAAFYGASVVIPLHSRSVQLRDELTALRNTAGHTPVAADDVPSGADRAKSFREFFPGHQDASYWLGKLYDIAGQEKLQLLHGDYRTDEVDGKYPHQMKISLPVRGSYTQIRRFAMGALAEIPFLSLDEVSFQRSDVGSTNMEAQIGFTLFLGDSS